MSSDAAPAYASIPSAEQKFKMDASAQGCSGMFWRTRCEMGASGGGSDWPRNGTELVGKYTDGTKTWVAFSNGYYLPVTQTKRVLHEV